MTTPLLTYLQQEWTLPQVILRPPLVELVQLYHQRALSVSRPPLIFRVCHILRSWLTISCFKARASAPPACLHSDVPKRICITSNDRCVTSFRQKCAYRPVLCSCLESPRASISLRSRTASGSYSACDLGDMLPGRLEASQAWTSPDAE